MSEIEKLREELAEAKRDAAQARAANLENSLALAEARGALRSIRWRARVAVSTRDYEYIEEICGAALARAGEQERAGGPTGEPASSGQEVGGVWVRHASTPHAIFTPLCGANPRNVSTTSMIENINCVACRAAVAEMLNPPAKAASTPPPGEQGKGGGASAAAGDYADYLRAKPAPAQPAEHPASGVCIGSGHPAIIPPMSTGATTAHECGICHQTVECDGRGITFTHPASGGEEKR